jgi:two-component system, OmpR family, sensor histidine kinase CiaH
MFKEARIKLTLYYLAIIMVINIFFSLIIYRGATAELRRIETVQHLRLPMPIRTAIDPEVIEETKRRVALSLVYLNVIILGMAGVGGYFLAGKTLGPIKKNMDEQKDFISNASHELRTPLTSLKTEIEVALRDKKMTLVGAKKLFQSNLDDVNKMTSLSNYLLELNKFQRGKDNIKFTKVDLSKIATKAIGKKNVKSHLTNVEINGNQDSLVELATILIDNAFKYSGTNPKIEVKVVGKTLEVKDNGMGISESDLPHVFDRFYRGDKSRQKDGYGLGLSIAKQIADMHGAKIIVVSKVNKGTSFKVVFS